MLQFIGMIEMILDWPLLAAGDDDDLLDAGRDRLLDTVLDDRFVDQRQHFLWLGLRGRQEAGAPAGGWEDGFSDAQRDLEWQPWEVEGHVEGPGRYGPLRSIDRPIGAT